MSLLITSCKQACLHPYAREQASVYNFCIHLAANGCIAELTIKRHYEAKPCASLGCGAGPTASDPAGSQSRQEAPATGAALGGGSKPIDS